MSDRSQAGIWDRSLLDLKTASCYEVQQTIEYHFSFSCKPKWNPLKWKSASTEFGFSLIELIVVVAILAILSAISLPMFLRFIEDAAIRTAQASLINAHKECQININRGNPNPTYEIPSNNGYFQVPDLGADGFCLDPASGNILTAARTDGGLVSTFNLNINVVNGQKSTDRAVPSWVDWQ